MTSGAGRVYNKSCFVSLYVSVTVCLLGTLAAAADAVTVTSLMKKDLPDYPGKEGLMISVD